MTRFSPQDAAAMQSRVNQGAGKPRYWVGVDPGTHCGLALWDSQTRSFVDITSGTPIEMEHRVLQLHAVYAPHKIRVVVEDTRNLRLPMRLQNNNRLKGVGAIHAQMTRWDQFCEYHQLDYIMQPISKSIKRKMKYADFVKMTGWTKRTNEHERDSACIVFDK